MKRSTAWLTLAFGLATSVVTFSIGSVSPAFPQPAPLAGSTGGLATAPEETNQTTREAERLPVQKLGDIRNIFVGPLGTASGAEVIRQKLILRLSQSPVVKVVENEIEADATLTGAAEVFSSDSTFYASLVARLVSRSKHVLWAEDAHPKAFGGRSRSSNVANQVADDLCRAILRDRDENRPDANR